MKNVILVFTLILLSCKQKEINGIIISSTLYQNQTIEQNKELTTLIKKVLNEDQKALSKVIMFSCGGAAGCYDLGFIVTQVIYKIGEKKFSMMIESLDKDNIIALEGLIIAGLEYGDNDKDGQMDNKQIEVEFPEILKRLKSKRGN